MDCAEFRSHFPGLAGKTFLDCAVVGLTSSDAADAVRGFAELALDMAVRNASAHHEVMDALRVPVYAEAARLLHCSPDEIALVESTSHGLNIAALAMSAGPLDNVVTCDLEFLQVAIPWTKLVEEGRLGGIRVARNEGGAVTVDAIAAQIDERTRAVVVSSVQWSNGYRLDLKELGRVCREKGALLVVDAIQELGAMRMDMAELDGVDILVAGGHKWLLSPFGCGVLFVRRARQAALAQPTWGYLGLTAPEQGWSGYFCTPSISPVRPYEFLDSAKRYELNGTSNYPGAVALGASLKLLNAVGADALEARVRELGTLLRESLAEAGATVVSHDDPATRSGITTFTLSGDPAEDEVLLQELLDARICVSRRYTSYVGGIRVSTHAYTTEDEIDVLCAAVRGAAERKARSGVLAAR